MVAILRTGRQATAALSSSLVLSYALLSAALYATPRRSICIYTVLKPGTYSQIQSIHGRCRQAELGIGDCGGLKYIPGMTTSGKQKTPEWLAKVLGVKVKDIEGEGKTLEDLLGPEANQ